MEVVKIEEEIPHGAPESGEESAETEPGCQLYEVHAHSLVEFLILRGKHSCISWTAGLLK